MRFRASVTAAVLLGVACLWARQPPSSDQRAPEITARDTPLFSTGVNLVSVPVVVRDRDGHAVGTLRKEDFQLFDKGKPQIISKFSIEKAETLATVLATTPGTSHENSAPTRAPLPIAKRFVAYLFDDVHLSFGDLAKARDAADLQIAQSLDGNTRVAIYTTSGLTTADFTGDRDALHAVLLKLRLRPALGTAAECPPLSDYMADLIANKRDENALSAAAARAAAICHAPPQAARSMAQGTAMYVVNLGERDTRSAFAALENAIRPLATAPGDRSLIFVSPGFFLPNEMRLEETDIMDRAIRANVRISSLNARGLYALDPGNDASTGTSNPAYSQYQRESARADEDVLAGVADGTGGTYFHNNNDLGLGFRRLASPPEFVYVLGFSPVNEKLDGSYHLLRVSLKNSKNLTLQARQGYYAPSHAVDAQEEARSEIQDALFSRDELAGIPIDLQLQFVSLSDTSARLAVLAHLNLKELHFGKIDRRNSNTLTITSGLFDTNGNYISAIQKVVDMRLRDQTLQDVQFSGMNVRTNFDVAPGSYVVRLVVRDAQGQTMAARTGAVEIP